MIEDFKNVIITFGLIAIVFLQGSYSYERKIQNDIIIAIQQENVQRIKNTVVTATEKDLLQNQLNQQQELINQQIPQNPPVIPNVQKNNLTTATISNKIQQELQDKADAKQKAQALAIRQAQIQAAIITKQQAQVLATQKAKVAQRTKITTPSRQSRAS